MPSRIAVVAALAALAGAGAGARHLVHMRRALVRERAVRRLEGAALHRDLETVTVRLHNVIADRAVLAAADAVLDTALASRHNPEGGPAS